MADANIKKSYIHSDQSTNNVDETPLSYSTDNFAPFSCTSECIYENVDISHNAPDENMWYHGVLDRYEAEKRLNSDSRLGVYLVRETDRKPGSYVLSFLGESGTNHFRITAMCGDYYIGGREFDTLSDLIGYYTSYSDLLKGERLRYPVAPPEPIFDKKKVYSILPYNKIPDTDELSFVKGEVFIIHNDMGDGWLWVTSEHTTESGIVNTELMKEQRDDNGIENRLWFHEDITKKDAAERLGKAGPKSWLVRPSESCPEDFSLFFYCQDQVQRFRIQRQRNQFYMGGRIFDSISGIIDRYKREQIVEGFTLGSAVLRTKAQSADQSQNEIYSMLKQSNGSNFLSNRRCDQIVIKGFLNKHSHRSKRWKNMYFVLNGTEQLLYFFDNERRSKPKGLIDLTYCSIYPVNDSFFGRPNCFQLIVRALNQVTTYYICHDSAEHLQEWIGALRILCVNYTPKKSTVLKTGARLSPTKALSCLEMRTLEISVYQSKRLPMKSSSSRPYCVLSLNRDVHVARTKEAVGIDPFWDHSFVVEDISSDIDRFTVTIFNTTKRKDNELASVTVNMDEQSNDTWYQMTSAYDCLKPCIRLKWRYIHEIIMPVGEYTTLKELLIEPGLETVTTLSEVCLQTYERTSLAKALLTVFRGNKEEGRLLEALCFRDIEREESSSTLFRGSSLAITLLDQYMKISCQEFLVTCIGSVVDYVTSNQNASCEINASLENSTDLESNAKLLISLLTQVVDNLFLATQYLPATLRFVFASIRNKVITKWPSDLHVKSRVVSGFIFLRYICIALIYPRKFNLVTEDPSDVAARSLKALANTLIKLATMNEAKDACVDCVNTFLRQNQQRMVMFLDDLCKTQKTIEPKELRSEDMARSLATIHRLCVDHADDLLNNSDNKGTVKTLMAVKNMLDTHYSFHTE